jgi:hypothetical protein
MYKVYEVKMMVKVGMLSQSLLAYYYIGSCYIV